MSSFRSLWDTLAPLGRTASGGYLRYSWSAADLACRDWFAEQARARDLAVDTDRNGNLWAWWGSASAGPAVVTGSHLDSVPYGGGYDGPLGIVSAVLAVDALRARGTMPAPAIGVVAFTEEEGARFGIPCLGSRLLTGAVDPTRAGGLRDRDGVTLAEAMCAAGTDPSALGPDPGRLGRIRAFVELHVEQGRTLAGLDAPVGAASAIWPHGRWRLDFAGEGNHAGTTRMTDRHDPMLTLAYTVLAANKEARLRGGHATVGRVGVEPNATNAVAARATAWLDARAADPVTLAALVAAVEGRARDRAGRDGTAVTIQAESVSPETVFDGGLRDRLAALLGAATDADCEVGVAALAAVLEELACRP